VNTLLKYPGAKSRRAFTLVETMIALMVLSVGSFALYDTYRTSIYLTDKNIAMNEANSSLEWAYYRMLTELDNAGAFVTCANYDPVARAFAPVAAGQWGNAIEFMRLLPFTGYVNPDDGSGYSVSNPPPPTRTVYLQTGDQFVFLTYNPALYSAAVIPGDARLYPTYPHVSQSVASGTNSETVPGLSYDVIDTSVSGLVGLHMPAVLGSNTFLDCNRAYFMVEAAFVVTTSTSDGHKTLTYIPDTNAPGASVTICSRLDGSNQTQPGDTSIPTGGTGLTFCMPAGGDAVQVLLPICSLEFLNVMTRAGGSAARNNTWINVNCKFRERVTL